MSLEIEKIIRNNPLFKGMKEEHLKVFIACASSGHVSKGQYIFKLGHEAKHFYLIAEGRVSLEINNQEKELIKIQDLTNGDIIGWSWLFPPYKWNFDARTIEDTSLITFNARVFMEKCKFNHELGYEALKRFSRVMVERLQASRMQIIELSKGKKGI